MAMEIPLGLRMALKGFGIEPEQFLAQASQLAAKVADFDNRLKAMQDDLQRSTQMLEMICIHLNLPVPPKVTPTKEITDASFP